VHRVPVDYDPYSDAAMSDPFPLYAAMRAEGGPYYIAKYDAWAITRFDDVVELSLREDLLDFSRGGSPGQVLLGEPSPASFATANAPIHRKWRQLVAPQYGPAAIRAEEERARELARSVLAPLIERGRMDVHNDYARPVMCRNSMHNLGLPMEDADQVSRWLQQMMFREKGQSGATAQLNQEAAGQLFGYLAGWIAQLRAAPERATAQSRMLLEGSIDGEPTTDEQLMGDLFVLLITGAETTPMATAGTLYYLAANPEQREAVARDPALARAAFLETCRYDQPTNMLARVARADFELSGRRIKAGQKLLMIYASANRDEAQFDRADTYDLFRDNRRHLSFGIGAHYCLGAHLGAAFGTIMVQELLRVAPDYLVLTEGCRRSYAEFLSGFVEVPLMLRAG
jgi:cytochrome P450